VAATNKNLAELVRSGTFREDLYYRIRVVHLELPGLSQRRGDIPLLIDHLVARFNRLQGKDIAGVSPDALGRLMEHDYPGNVRELENIIEYAFILCPGGNIRLEHLPEGLLPQEALGCALPLSGTLEDIKRRAVEEVLNRHGGRVMAACRELGVSKDTLRRILRKGAEGPRP